MILLLEHQVTGSGYTGISSISGFEFRAKLPYSRTIRWENKVELIRHGRLSSFSKL